MSGRDLGLCPICGRPMIAGASVDEQHWVPKSEGGRQTDWMHRICHRTLHARFTERELATSFATAESIRSDPDMDRFIRWVRKRPAEYMDWPHSVRKR